MLIDMKYITIFQGYEPSKRFCKQSDCVSRTVQDCIVDIPSLMREFNFKLDDLFDKYNNGLVYESTIGVFVDELNADEVKAHAEFVRKQQALEAEKKRNDELFEQWKLETAKKVAEAREKGTSVSTGHSEESKSD